MTRIAIRSHLAGVGRLLVALALLGGEGRAAVDFEEQVRPILEEHCYECHGPRERKGGLRLTSREEAFKAGDLGIPAIDPGSADTSFLYEFISSDDPEERMPKDRTPLRPAEIEILRRWIDEGAIWPDEDATTRLHWAYRPRSRPPLPQVRDRAWARNEIDLFVLERLERAELAPAPEAEPAVLLRRLYLDLIGLPPTPAETAAFVRDPSPQAYEAIVDRLLASPQFGELWAIPWLDLARYGDSTGFMSEVELSNWPYRDWVITAINADMPFDQFTIEQLAGDLLPSPTLSQRTATGFHRAAPLTLEAGVHEEDARIFQVIDRVNTTATVWLGSTLACAQCHDHKYEPISQEEYYRFLAFFNNTPKEAVGTESSGGVALVPQGPKLELPHLPRTRRQSREIGERLLAEISLSLESWDLADEPLEAEEREKILALAQAMQVREALAKASTALTDRLAVRDGPSPWRPWAAPWWKPWFEDAKARLRSGPVPWRDATVLSFSSSDGAPHRILDDGSVLLEGPAGDQVNYTVEIRAPGEEITGFRLEVLRDPSLPGGGPGRRNNFRPDFVLSELEVSLLSPEGESRIALEGAHASVAAPRGVAMNVIDDRDDTGWFFTGDALKNDQWLVLAASEPIPGAEDRRLRFVLRQQEYGGKTLGRFRLQVTSAPPAIVAMPLRLQQRVRDNEWEALTPAEQIVLYSLLSRSALPGSATILDRAKRAWANLPPAPRALVMEEQAPRQTHVFQRGDHRDPGPLVEPGTPGVWPPMRPDLPRNRLGLARWLVDPENPLTARVAVNRWWAALLGRGIVATVEDFGTRGSRPTHPRLLDWLASDLVDSGWSRKHVLRRIVLSSTYRQSANPAEPRTLEIDPENQLLARNPRRRLPAESIRDNALAIAGILSLTAGGPPVHPLQPPGVWRSNGATPARYQPSEGEDLRRRGIYTVWRRTSPYPSFVNFDASDRMTCTPRRSPSNTPLQALTLLNDEVYRGAALAFADRILRERPEASMEERIDYAFEVALARPPSPAERAAMTSFVEERLRQVRADPASAAALTTGGPDFAPAVDADRPALAAWFFVARVLLNLDETITRG